MSFPLPYVSVQCSVFAGRQCLRLSRSPTPYPPSHISQNGHGLDGSRSPGHCSSLVFDHDSVPRGQRFQNFSVVVAFWVSQISSQCAYADFTHAPSHPRTSAPRKLYTLNTAVMRVCCPNRSPYITLRAYMAPDSNSSFLTGIFQR